MRSGLILLFVMMSVSVSAQMFTDITPETGLATGYYNTAQFADVDNDGDLDIVITTDGGTTIHYNQNLDFSNSKLFEDFHTERQQPSVMDLGDFDRDGRVDILSGGGPNTSTFRVLLNKDPDYEVSKGLSVVQATRGPASFGDFDNDGDLDVLVDYNNTAYTNIGDSLVYSFYSIYIRDLTSVFWMDFDKDGRVETLATGGSYGTYNTYILEKDSAKHDPIANKIQTFSLYMNGARFADIDSDGDIDILGLTDKWKIYWNTAGTFTEGPSFAYSSTAEIADMNNDGKYDIVLAGDMEVWQQFHINIYANDGTNFTKVADVGTALTDERTHMALGDIDNDGDLDILGVKPGKLYLNNTVTANAKPGVPVNLSETVNGINAIFHWTAPTDDHTNANGLTYNVDLRTSSGTIITPSHSMPDGKRMITDLGNAYNNSSYRIGCLREGSYTWKVQALDASYVGSPFTTGRVFTVGDVKPVAPANLHASGYTDKSVKLTWTDGSDNETAYVIQKKSPIQEVWYDIDTISANSTSYIDTLYIEPRTSYNYRVVAYNCAYLNEYGTETSGSSLPRLFEQSSHVPEISGASNSFPADVDNDGDLDLLLSNNGTLKPALLKFDGTSMQGNNIEIPDIGDRQIVEWIDINGDGFLDLIKDQTGFNYSIVKAFISDKGNSFTETDLDIDWSFASVGRKAWTDYDLDGDMDVIIVGGFSSGSPSEMKLYENRGNFIFKEKDLEFKAAIGSSDAWSDYDLDGDPDLLAFTSSTNCSVNSIVIFKNSGDGTFEKQQLNFGGFYVDSYDNMSAYSWVDLNNDGYPDIFAAGRQSCDDYLGSFLMLINNGAGGFTMSAGASQMVAVNQYIDIKFGDLDLDGWQDAVVYGNRYSGMPNTRVYLNKNGVFENTKISYLPQYDYTGNIQLGDFDNDDDLDLFVGGEITWTSNVFIGYENNMTDSWGGTNTPPSVPTGLHGEMKGDIFEMSWTGSSDDTTPDAAITYEVFLMIDDEYVVSANSNADGTRKLVTTGNSGARTSKAIKISNGGNVKWGVQAIDASYKGSAFATQESVVTVGLEDETPDLQVYPNPAKDQLFVRAVDGSPQIFDLVGRKIPLPLKLNGDLYEINTHELSNGLYIVKTRTASKKIKVAH